jgi:Kef-type K+ transport system membrane component KefB
MSVELLAWLIVAGLAGPLLRIPKRVAIPVAVGELLVGALFGASGLRKIPYQDPTLKFLATVGFALLMFAVGSHINYRALTKASFKRASLILSANLAAAILVALAISHLTDFSNWKLIAVIAFSSSAALVLPIAEKLNPSASVSTLITQVTLADALAFLALPFFTQQSGQLQATEGAGFVLLASAAIYFALKYAKGKSWLEHTHAISKAEALGLELRISLALLLMVATVALHFHASVMIAGFTLGVAIACIGVPHRLARQLFAVSDGFFAPIFFVWLGASSDVRATFHSRNTILLAALLCIAALLAHAPGLLLGQPTRYVFLASAQLGIPAAAVTLGAQNGILNPGQSGAIMLSALVTIHFTI